MATEIPDDDPHLLTVRKLLDDGYAGVILSGPPGTGKTWYAAQIAGKLVGGSPARVRFVQFHPSYQYEDFVEGYIPMARGGFRLAKRHLLQMCDLATRQKDALCVIVIDEISRCDPVRIFGEALTYVEMTKRGLRFHLASGRQVSIPTNLVFLATMNPFDRGVEELDVAFERRFARIPMEPDEEILREFLKRNGMDAPLSARVIVFFNWVQQNRNPYARIGHAYFYGVRDEVGLRRLWENQLRFFFEKAFRQDPEGMAATARAWERIWGDVTPS